MLIVADSIVAALTTSPVPLSRWQTSWRIAGLLGGAATRDPSDPQVRYELGEANYHWGANVPRRMPSSALREFERAIALDSLFALPYVHAVELKLNQGDPVAALRYFDRLRALGADRPAGNEPGRAAIPPARRGERNAGQR